MTAQVRCPDCGAVIGVPDDVQSGNLVDCPNCAGHGLRLREEGGEWTATLVHRISCPACAEVITLPDDVKPADTISCCGRLYRLTFEYGAYAAEEA